MSDPETELIDLTLHKKRVSKVTNKDLLTNFHDSTLPGSEEDAKDVLSDLLESNTTNSSTASQLKDHLFESFKHAQKEIRKGE